VHRLARRRVLLQMTACAYPGPLRRIALAPVLNVMGTRVLKGVRVTACACTSDSPGNYGKTLKSLQNTGVHIGA